MRIDQEQARMLDLIHSDLPTEEDLRHTEGWNHYLGRLSKAAVGVDPGPDPHAEPQAIMHDGPGGES